MKQILIILVFEDNPNDANLIVSELRTAGFEPQWKRVENELGFHTEIMNLSEPLVPDNSTPYFSGLRAAQFLLESGLKIPFIRISVMVGEAEAAEAMKHGITDCLLKRRWSRFGQAVEHALEQKRFRHDPADPVSTECRFRHRDGCWRTTPSLGRSIDGDESGRLVVVNSRNFKEQQTQEAEKMEAFGQLASGVAHELNNFLTDFSRRTELLLTTDSSEEQLLGEIREPGERAATQTRHFSWQQELEPPVVDLNTVVTDMKTMLGRLIGEEISLVSNLSPDLSPVKVGPGQMHQVIVNLAVNARDAMPRGGKLLIETHNVEIPKVRATSRSHSEPENYVMLAVTDNGSGMRPEVAAHILEPYFTTTGPAKQRDSGWP